MKNFLKLITVILALVSFNKNAFSCDAIKNVQEVFPDLRVTFEENPEMALYDSVSDIGKARMLLDWFPQNASTAMSSIIKKEMVLRGDQ